MTERRKTLLWVLVFALLAGVLLVFVLRLRSGGGTTAQVWQGGELVAELDLTEDTTLELTSPQGGSNTVLVRDGQVFVIAADCPDQVCVDHGPAESGSPIVCLPNELVISLVGESSEGADARVG